MTTSETLSFLLLWGVVIILEIRLNRLSKRFDCEYTLKDGERELKWRAKTPKELADLMQIIHHTNLDQ